MVAAAALSAAASHPPNEFVKIRLVSMCPPRTGPVGSLRCDVRGDPGGLETATGQGPTLSTRCPSTLTISVSRDAHLPLPSAREDRVWGARGGFGQVLDTRLASRGDALSLAACRIVYARRQVVVTEPFASCWQIHTSALQDGLAEMTGLRQDKKILRRV